MLSRLRLMAEGDPTWDLSRNDMAAIRHALDTIDTLEGGLALDNAICLCGCPSSEHESYGEDGESCGVDGHECIRVAPAVLEIVQRERAILTAASAVAPSPADPARDVQALLGKLTHDETMTFNWLLAVARELGMERAKGPAVAELPDGAQALVYRRALEDVERHHVELNAAVQRPESRSATLRIVRKALAGAPDATTEALRRLAVPKIRGGRCRWCRANAPYSRKSSCPTVIAVAALRGVGPKTIDRAMEGELGHETCVGCGRPVAPAAPEVHVPRADEDDRG
jgi:hypothetical protein